MIIPAGYVDQFPLIPGGGLFFIPIGLCVVLGAFVPRIRLQLVFAGIALGVLTAMLGGPLYKGLPPPTRLQLAFFVVSIIVEAIAFRVLIPRIRAYGERLVLIGTLAIVGAHFLIMIPAFGLPIAVLAALCLLNAALGYRTHAYPVRAMWLVDGLFKTATGVVMMLASPFFLS